MEADFRTRLDWIAIDYCNTVTRMCIGSCAASTTSTPNLSVSRDYISCGLRSCDDNLINIELNPQLKHKIRNKLKKETLPSV